MMYGGSDAATHLGPPSGRPEGPGDGLRVSGLERRRRRRLERRLVPRLLAAGAPLRADRLRGVLRLPGQPPERPVQRRPTSARSSGRRSRSSRRPRRARRATSCSCRASSRRCAGAPSRAHRRPRRSARRAGRRHARRAARRRAAYAPGDDLRSRLRPRPDGAPGHAAASTYEGPTGIVGVLHSACAQAGLPSASLWAGVPHYVAAAANPKAALALVRRVEGLIGVSVDVSELESRRRRLRAPGRPRRAERPRHPGVRRTARAGRRERRGRVRRGRPLRRRDRARIPALPAPARARRARKCRAAARAPAPAALGRTTSRPPGRRSGSRRSSTPHARASARTAGARMPSPTSITMSVTDAASCSQRGTGTFRSSST